MNFTTIDFETANDKRCSACSLGLVVVKNGQISDSRYWLIRPEPFEIGPFQKAVHGFELEDLADQPTFNQLWPEIQPFVEGQTVIAHNASFDLSVLKQVLTHYELALPNLQLNCSVRMAKAIWKEELRYSLDWLAWKRGINLEHHHALEDAKACAQLVLLMAQDYSVTSIEELSSKCNAPLRAYEQFGRGPINKVKVTSLVANTDEFDPEHILFGKHIAFTGTLENFTRSTAQQIVLNIGGIPLDGINAKTNYLVLGNQDFDRFGSGFKSSKLQKAEKMIQQGQELEIISEDQFLSLIR